MWVFREPNGKIAGRWGGVRIWQEAMWKCTIANDPSNGGKVGSVAELYLARKKK